MKKLKLFLYVIGSFMVLSSFNADTNENEFRTARFWGVECDAPENGEITCCRRRFFIKFNCETRDFQP